MPTGKWRRLAPVLLLARIILAIAINVLALWVANVLWDSVDIHGFWAYFIGAVVLGIANAVIKPILAILTLPLIVLTLGIFYLLINIAMVPSPSGSRRTSRSTASGPTSASSSSSR